MALPAPRSLAAALLGGVLTALLLLAGCFLRPPPQPDPTAGAALAGGAVVAWSAGYRVSFYGIERLHPFDIAKNETIAAHLVDEGLLSWEDFATPDAVDPALLAAVHDPAYLASLTDPRVLSGALEVSVPGFFPASAIERRVLGPFRRQVQGTVLAARGALAHGLGVNLGGGFHHARPAMGHGFCVYGDVAVALHALRADGFTGRVVVLDTDAHQGDGTHAFFADDPAVHTVSLQQAGIFPQPRVPGDLDVELPAGTDDAAYLATLDRVLADLPWAEADLLVHVAGSDVLGDDPLAGLALTPDGLLRRDLAVLQAARARGVPVLHLLAGGYGPSSATAQGASVAAMLRAVRGG